MIKMAHGHPAQYSEIVSVALKVDRWIGKSRCGARLKLEGRAAMAVLTRSGVKDDVILSSAGELYTTRVIGDTDCVLVHCVGCGKYTTLRKVHEGKKNSKHTCGARCTNATGPSCDCRCKGANHGSNC